MELISTQATYVTVFVRLGTTPLAQHLLATAALITAKFVRPSQTARLAKLATIGTMEVAPAALTGAFLAVQAPCARVV